MNAKHTATPWCTESDGALVIGDQVVAGPLGPDYASLEEREANNRLIVRACNAHEDLIAALKFIRPIIENPAGRTMGDFAAALAEIDAALAKATGSRAC